MVSASSNTILNVPNVLTAIRFLLSIVVFVLIPLHHYLAAMIVFIVAASTDWIDGWWARKFDQVTKLGRIFDPFVDKIIICGTFIFLGAEGPASGIAPWMAVVVMGREMLVTAIRSEIEGRGGDFSAKTMGKLKMVFQCAAAVASLMVLWHGQHLVVGPAPANAPPAWLYWTLQVSVWFAIITTVYSGLEYVVAATRILSRQGS